MKIAKTVIAMILGVFMIYAASGHITNPEMSAGFIPELLPQGPVHILIAIIEAGLGILTLIPKTRKYGLTGIFFLMIAFLPLHIIDFFRDQPILGSKTAAAVRVLVQFVLISLPWFANKPTSSS